MKSRLLTDSSRTNTARRTNHQFMITIWYPAKAPAGAVPAPYLERQLVSPYATFFGYAAFGSLALSFVGHAFSEPPLATSPTPFPIVLYSPSLNSRRSENLYKVQELASHGFVVVGMDHRETYASLFPDGKVVYGQTVAPNSQMQSFVAAVGDRAADGKLVIDRLTAWEETDPFFRGHLDLQRVGAFGFSLGGGTAAELCRTDPRFRAGVSLDGGFFGTTPVSTPFMFVAPRS